MAFTIPDDEDPDLRVLHMMERFPFRRALMMIKLWYEGEYDHMTEDELRKNAYDALMEAEQFQDTVYTQFFKADIDSDDFSIVLTLNLYKACDYEGLLESKADNSLGFHRENNEDQVWGTGD